MLRNGKGMADGMFTLRKLVEKRLEVQGGMALGFVDLEKADDTVLRDGDGDTEVDESARSTNQVCGRDVQGNEGKSFDRSWDV